jgi:hypothetical protein
MQRKGVGSLWRKGLFQLADLATWLANFHHQLWDKQIENDLDSGRLDSVIAAAEKEYQAGLARPL